MQEIVWQMYNEGAISNEHIMRRVPFLEVGTIDHDKMPSPDLRSLPSPRLIKSHLSYSTTPKSANEDMQCKYIYVARNPKDTAVSYFHFMETLAAYNGFNGPWEFYLKLFKEGNGEFATCASFFFLCVCVCLFVCFLLLLLLLLFLGFFFCNTVKTFSCDLKKLKLLIPFTSTRNAISRVGGGVRGVRTKPL